MLAIFKKEIRLFLYTPLGWVFTGLFLLSSGIFFLGTNIFPRNSEMSLFFRAIQTVYLFTVPILTMRSLSEEKASKTDQLLYTCPVSLGSIVLGKYLAAFTLFLLSLALTGLHALTLLRFGDLPFGETFGSYLGYALMGGSFIAIGITISAATENQVISAILTFFALLLLTVMESLIPVIPSGLGKILPVVMKYVSPTIRFKSFSSGYLLLEDLWFFLSLIAFFLVLTVYLLERRRER